jgi:hypothetical protein
MGPEYRAPNYGRPHNYKNSVMENVGELYMGQGLNSLETLPGNTIKERWQNFVKSIPL